MTTNILTTEDYNKIEKINQKLKKNPNNLDLLMEKAYVYFSGYDDENAINTYKHIIELNPNYVEAFFWLALYHYRGSGDMDEAIKIASEGLKIDPNYGGLYAVIAWAIGEFQKGFLPYMKKAIELDPTWISTRISLIEHLIKFKKFGEAKKEIAIADKYIQNNKLAMPESDMQKYYEKHVTRRISDSTKEDLADLFKKINNLEKKSK